jgi:acyl carrier protein
MSSRAEIFERVQSTLVDALGVDEDEVRGESTLVGDLGAESIDFLDIVFRLEKNFNIKIPRGDLFPETILTDPQFVEGGKLTSAGMEELRTKMPWVDVERVRQNPNVQDLFTVDMIVNYVAEKTGNGSK